MCANSHQFEDHRGMSSCVLICRGMRADPGIDERGRVCTVRIYLGGLGMAAERDFHATRELLVQSEVLMQSKWPFLD